MSNVRAEPSQHTALYVVSRFDALDSETSAAVTDSPEYCQSGSSVTKWEQTTLSESAADRHTRLNLASCLRRAVREPLK